MCRRIGVAADVADAVHQVSEQVHGVHSLADAGYARACPASSSFHIPVARLKLRGRPVLLGLLPRDFAARIFSLSLWLRA